MSSSMASGSSELGGVQVVPPALAPVSQSRATRMLPVVLSMVAGSVDMIGFLGLGGLFTAHVTGNLVVLAAHFLANSAVPVAHVIAVPIFVSALALTRLFVSGLERAGIGSLQPLLLLHALILCGFTAIGVAAGRHPDPGQPMMILAGMLGVSAMAAQNALVRVSLTGTPSTAVMTTNITVFVMDLGEILLGRDPHGAAQARDRARRTGPLIAGFLVGCALGASCEAAYGLAALVVPSGLALVAIAMGVASRPSFADQ